MGDAFRWLLTSLRMETRQGGEEDGEPEDRVITGWGDIQGEVRDTTFLGTERSWVRAGGLT